MDEIELRLKAGYGSAGANPLGSGTGLLRWRLMGCSNWFEWSECSAVAGRANRGKGGGRAGLGGAEWVEGREKIEMEGGEEEMLARLQRHILGLLSVLLHLPLLLPLLLLETDGEDGRCRALPGEGGEDEEGAFILVTAEGHLKGERGVGAPLASLTTPPTIGYSVVGSAYSALL